MAKSKAKPSEMAKPSTPRFSMSKVGKMCSAVKHDTTKPASIVKNTKVLDSRRNSIHPRKKPK